MTNIGAKQPGSKYQCLGFVLKILAFFLVFSSESISLFFNSNILYNIGICYADKQNSMVTLEKQGTESQPDIYVSNTYPVPVEVEVSLTKAHNIISSPVLPARFVIPKQSKIKIFTLRPSMTNESFSYAYQYSFTIGDPRAEHHPPKPYRPPFPNGNRFRISRSFQNNSSAGDAYNAFAVNILIPKKVPVCAARKGIVIDIETRTFTRRTRSGNIQTSTTRVRLLHDDGTMGVYAHLKTGSVIVSTGMKVEEKQVIGEPGISNNSDMSYLYFAVQKNSGMKLESIPFKFEDPNSNKGISPVKGMVLRTE